VSMAAVAVLHAVVLAQCERKVYWQPPYPAELAAVLAELPGVTVVMTKRYDSKASGAARWHRDPPWLAGSVVHVVTLGGAPALLETRSGAVVTCVAGTCVSIPARERHRVENVPGRTILWASDGGVA